LFFPFLFRFGDDRRSFFFGIADGDATLASPRKLREDKEREEKDWINAEDIFVFFFF